MKKLLPLIQWMHLHPIKLVLFTMLFTSIATAAGFREDLFWPLLGLFAVVLALWIAVVVRDNREPQPKMGFKLMCCVLLFAGQLQLRAEEPPRAVGIGVGAVVICAGGYCVYKIVKFCQRKFPPKSTDTNAQPSLSFALAASPEDGYGAALEYSSIGSCYSPDDLSFGFVEQRNPTTFTLNVVVGQTGVSATMAADSRVGVAQTWNEFAADMASHGLFLTGRPSYEPQYSRGGIPCQASDVPLRFDPLTGRAEQLSESTDIRRVVVERSHDLQQWLPLLVTDVAVRTRFRVVDTTTDGHMFYRVGLKPKE